MSTIHEGFSRFVELSHSLDDQVKMVEARAKVSDEPLKLLEARELKLREELDSLQSSFEAATWELETWLAKKKEVLAKRRGYIAKVETQLSHTEGLL